MRYLIINTDGYGFTAGITRAIEECVEFGTVKSLSANVNFKHAENLTITGTDLDLAKKVIFIVLTFLSCLTDAQK